MSLEGTLKDISLPNLMQLQCSEQKRAQLTLTRQSLQGVLFFVDGELVHASTGSISGEDAVYELLTWDEGNFQINDEVANLPARNINAPWQSLILEGLRRADEIRAERVQAIAVATKEMENVPGVAEWHLVTMNGQEINSSGGGTLSPIAEWTMKAFQEGARLARTLGMGELREIVSSNSKQKRILVRRDRYCLLVVPSANVTITAVRDALSQTSRH